jgi:hypothetical protein
VFLDSRPGQEREAWITMEMIETRNRWVPRASSCSSVSNGSRDRKVMRVDIIYERGIFGTHCWERGTWWGARWGGL